MLALIAGQGGLPGAVFSSCRQTPIVCALEHMPPDSLSADMTFRLETLGTLVSRLVERGVDRLCMCGTIRRPDIDPAVIDAATAPLVPRIAAALELGDDGALRAIIEIFEEAGITVIGAHEAAPRLLPPAGVLTHARPRHGDEQAAKIGDLVSREQGKRDLGQSCVVDASSVRAREDDAGTDAMLDGLEAGGGAILYKAEKPGQDRRADLPVIGPQTIEKVVEKGLTGIVLSHEGVMVLDLDRVVAQLDAAGRFLWIRNRDGA
ncbi:hypothetical protein GCM10011415_00620 [Salipiger pallidus]|uniref:Phosphatidate cytidylyltransferase n=1 Tax=Salipiger pallidus TaxID=1775170 RepID=A0A8J3ED97_9RHOB|nr:UDP-2,3-diacylglucosamine diphosphatase LpxI [Salipiger pallidus]GGG58689.1 hypothetical protein GCM10011415_00620 [Salipiger pallidus]